MRFLMHFHVDSLCPERGIATLKSLTYFNVSVVLKAETLSKWARFDSLGTVRTPLRLWYRLVPVPSIVRQYRYGIQLHTVPAWEVPLWKMELPMATTALFDTPWGLRIVRHLWYCGTDSSIPPANASVKQECCCSPVIQPASQIESPRFRTIFGPLKVTTPISNFEATA